MDTKDRIQLFKSDVDGWLVDGILPRAIVIVLGLYLLLVIVLGVIWTGEPEVTDVRLVTEDYSARESRGIVPGSFTTATLIYIAETLLDKQGGFLSNDITPPGVMLDNMPNWEFGVLVQVRDLSRAMRENFSRSQSQSTEDADLSIAEPRFHFDNESWIFPRSEDEYREGIRYTKRYLQRLSDPGQAASQFYARADNLATWLATVETRLGSLSHGD